MLEWEIRKEPRKGGAPGLLLEETLKRIPLSDRKYKEVSQTILWFDTSREFKSKKRQRV